MTKQSNGTPHRVLSTDRNDPFSHRIEMSPLRGVGTCLAGEGGSPTQRSRDHSPPRRLPSQRQDPFVFTHSLVRRATKATEPAVTTALFKNHRTPESCLRKSNSLFPIRDSIHPQITPFVKQLPYQKDLIQVSRQTHINGKVQEL